MSGEIFLNRLMDSVIIGDGAMGTMVQKSTDNSSSAPESIMLKKPDLILNIHKQYMEAGSNLIETNTFGANRLKLLSLGLADKVQEINEKAVKIARQAAGKTGLVAGSIGPTGKLMKPYGELSIERAKDIFAEQISYLVKSGVDAIIIETMSDLVEMKAAVLAAKEFKIPIVAQMTFVNSGKTLTGISPEIAAIVLEGLNVDVIGVNCVAGLKEAIPIIAKISEISDKILSVYANAGIPLTIDGKINYPESPEEYVSLIPQLFHYNVRIIGGCCGTSPDYIKAIKNEIYKSPGVFFSDLKDNLNKGLILSGSREYISLSEDSPVFIIGEKLNPTGRKDIKKALKDEDWPYLKKIAREQVKAGAKFLDVNIGISGIDKIKVMKRLIQELQVEIPLPLVIDSNDPVVLEAGLEVYIGKPIINSITGEQKVMDKIFPMVKKYGTAVIGLTLDDRGIPSTVEGRLAIARKIVEEADRYGVNKENIFIDPLTLTAGSEQDQVMVTLETIKRVKDELGVLTTLGLSNISHGLPERELINRVFLGMAIGYGLNLPIANPFDDSIHQSIEVANLLTNRDKNGKIFIRNYAVKKDEFKDKSRSIKRDSIKVKFEDSKTDRKSLKEDIRQAILNGDNNNIVNLSKMALNIHTPQEIIDLVLIPAIQEVGDYYDRGVYFLPQLLKSAETMQASFDFLKEKMLKKGEVKSKARLLLATVKGDIHDIGKNIVKTIFMNHGYEIIDLGANVDTNDIVETAIKKKVDFVGLSSLMTTTLEEMKRVIQVLKEKNYQGKIIIGGAVTSQEYADEIGADIYAKDALDGVKKINKLFKTN